MNTKRYWEEAALRREVAIQEGATPTIKQILLMYEDALDDINSEIKKIEYNYRKRYGLDEKEAAYFLTKEQRNKNLEKLTQALLDAPNEEARREIYEYVRDDGLSVRAYSARIERFKAMRAVIVASLKEVAHNETAALKKITTSAYKEAYYGVIDDIAKGVNMGINFTVIDDKAVEEVVTAKWHGARFSERIWKETDRLASEAQEIVVRYITSGRSLTKAAAELERSFGVAEYRATTLVRTEVAHAHAVADLKAYEELGIEEYKYLAMLDYRTCETCQPLDGQVFKLSEAKEGVNYPVMHPRCRCTTTLNIDFKTRRAKDPLTGKYRMVDGNTTYKDWRESLSPEQEAALKLAQKKDARKTADKVQYIKYKNVLGTKNVPKSLDAFQNLMYTGGEEWERLKLQYKDKTLQNRIREKYNLTIHKGKQGKHILGHNNYIEGRSYITVSLDEAQELVNKYAGTGHIDRNANTNKWKNTETIKIDREIGVDVDNRTGSKTITDTFKIHYSKNGVHIVPKRSE